MNQPLLLRTIKPLLFCLVLGTVNTAFPQQTQSLSPVRPLATCPLVPNYSSQTTPRRENVKKGGKLRLLTLSMKRRLLVNAPCRHLFEVAQASWPNQDSEPARTTGQVPHRACNIDSFPFFCFSVSPFRQQGPLDQPIHPKHPKHMWGPIIQPSRLQDIRHVGAHLHCHVCTCMCILRIRNSILVY